MLASFAVVLPIFGLIGVGYLARRLGLLTDRAGEGLSEFVFALAVPCLIFRTLARAELPPAQPWGYWFSYFGGVATVWALATLAAGRFFGLKGVVSVVAGFSAGQANTVFVGVPLILSAYGERGAVPLALLLAVHLPVTIFAATLLAEGRRTSLALLARRLVTHPIIAGILVGMLYRGAGSPVLPATAWQMIDLLAGAAVPCALVAMGVAMHRYGLEAGWRLPGILTGLKLVLHPLIVLLLAHGVFGLDPAWTGVAVLFAASPSGINAYLFAERYGEGVGLASSTIAISTGLALLTTAAWLQVLGVAG